jgi:hypothetical protein
MPAHSGEDRLVPPMPEPAGRQAPPLAGPAAARAGSGAPEEAGLAVQGRAGRGVAAQVAGVPAALDAARVTRVRVAARVVALQRRAADAGHPGLAGRVLDVDDRGAVEADAVEGAGVARGAEQALALRGHLLEDDVLGLHVGPVHVVLAYAPAGADRRGGVLLGDRGVLVKFGLAGLVVRGVVHQQVAGVGRDRQFLLDVRVDLDVARVVVDRRRARSEVRCA